MTVLARHRENVPYFSQWESPDLALEFIADEANLRRDARWASSGASSSEEYAMWANHICGMACLKMVLAARTGRVWPTLELARAATRYGAYTVDHDGIKGLIYAPFVRFTHREFDIRSDVKTHVDASALGAIMGDAEFFIASVHHSIRWPDTSPPKKGGHLVLVTEASNRHVRFHNPSGHDDRARADVVIPLDVFGRFFAGRGIQISK
jgi:hypothetical protein